MKQEVLFSRVEGVAIFAFAVYFFTQAGFNILWLTLLLLSIDAFMAGYLVNNRIGAYIYNVGHTLTIPFLVLIFSAVIDNLLMLGFSYIWIAHIGVDRAFGYGLKLETSFNETTLGKIGKKK